MYSVYLKKGKEKRVVNGYPWIYANEVERIEGKDVKGSICTVYSFDKKFICKGFINHLSKILVRVLTTKNEDIDYNFFYNRFLDAYKRKISLGFDNSFRLVFGENDLIPGLIVDKYSDVLVLQINSLGVEVRKEEFCEILKKITGVNKIYLRNDSQVRIKEGLPLFKGWFLSESETKIEIEENGLKLIVDIENGQKTGYFLDQKFNRDNLKYYCKNKNVLDCFCNEGGFSLCASKYGAKEIESVDISSQALELVEENSRINNFKNIRTIKADVFEYLRELKKDGKKYGLVILDPPAFTKSVDTVNSAIKGYKDINILGLKLVEKDGYLITCSCSQHLSLSQFLDMIKESVIESGVNCQMIEFRSQSSDHGTLVTFDEGLYLKVAVLKII